MSDEPEPHSMQCMGMKEDPKEQLSNGLGFKETSPCCYDQYLRHPPPFMLWLIAKDFKEWLEKKRLA